MWLAARLRGWGCFLLPRGILSQSCTSGNRLFFFWFQIIARADKGGIYVAKLRTYVDRVHVRKSVLDQSVEVYIHTPLVPVLCGSPPQVMTVLPPGAGFWKGWHCQCRCIGTSSANRGQSSREPSVPGSHPRGSSQRYGYNF